MYISLALCLSLGIVAVIAANGNHKNEVQQLPEVLVPTTYKNNLAYENPTACPRNITPTPPAEYQYGDAEQAVEFQKHCKKCSIGVYSMHEGKTVRHCTWCNDLEEPETTKGE